MNCKNCKWWGTFRPRTVTAECERADVILSPDDNTAPLSPVFAVVAHAADSHNLTAKLVTGPEFGCVHYEAKS